MALTPPSFLLAKYNKPEKDGNIITPSNELIIFKITQFSLSWVISSIILYFFSNFFQWFF